MLAGMVAAEVGNGVEAEKKELEMAEVVVAEVPDTEAKSKEACT